MKAPRSDQRLPALVWLYSLALGLYPASFRSEFAEEMQAIFCLRLEDAVSRGRGALLDFACKEALTFPSGAVAAHAQAKKNPNFITFALDLFNLLLEKGSKMSIRQHFPQSAEQTPWFIAILSLVPFLLPGPLAALLTYHPWWNPNALPLIAAARVPLTVGLLILGFLIGILRRFPRWSYLYSLYFLFVLPLGVIYLVDSLLFKINPNLQGYIFMLVVLLMVALAVIARRSLLFMRPFFTNIRQDWTLLSYAFYACIFLLLSSNDMSESSVYNLQVLLPSLIAWLGALAYLCLVDPLKKVGALLGAVLLGVSIWWWPVLNSSSGSLVGLLAVSGILLISWIALGGLILAPILISGSFRRRSKSVV